MVAKIISLDMFNDAELQAAAKFCAVLEKQAFSDPHQFDYNLGMPDLDMWKPKPPTLGDAAGHIFTGLGKQLGTTAQTILTGRNNPGVLENFASHGIKFLAHPTDPQRFRELFSMRNITQPFQRAMPEYHQAWRETGELGRIIRPELGERYRILKGVFNNPGAQY